MNILQHCHSNYFVTKFAHDYTCNVLVSQLLQHQKEVSCFACASTEVEDLAHFFVNCRDFIGQFESVWSNLDAKIISSDSLDGGAIGEFIRNLKHQEML